MADPNIIVEEDFSLEFLTFKDRDEWSQSVRDNRHGAHLLHQRIIVPENLVESFWESVSQLTPESRYANPLVLLAKKGHPVYQQAIIAKPRSQHVQINRILGGVRLLTPRLTMLVSDPIHAKATADQNEFCVSFDEMSKVLASAGMVETDLARTWFYLEDIDATYGLLNRARHDYFSRVLDGSRLPASTGVGGISNRHSPLSVMFWAVSGEDVRVVNARSPLQREPTDYAVLFSRAVCVRFPLNTLLLISGTASIDSQGRTIHVGNCRAQMERTLMILSALLQEYGGNFKNILQAVIYIKREEQIALCEDAVREADFPLERAMIQVADMCREELLCEIEVHAVIRNHGN